MNSWHAAFPVRLLVTLEVAKNDCMLLAVENCSESCVLCTCAVDLPGKENNLMLVTLYKNLKVH